MVQFANSFLLVAISLLLVTQQAISGRIFLKEFLAERNNNSDPEITKRGGWSGVKAYPYSPNCGKDGDWRGYTWLPSQIGRGCYTYNSGDDVLDMWSIEWSDYASIAKAISCEDVCYQIELLMYHCGHDCSCGAAPYPLPIGGYPAGCGSIGHGRFQESIKSFQLNCIPSGCTP